VHKPIYFNVIVVTFMFIMGMYLVPIACMDMDLSCMPGDMTDNRLNNYFLEHGFKWLVGQQNSFWDAPFFYPASQVMTLSDNHLGTLLIYSSFRLLKFSQETSYQLWMLVLYTLNFFSAVYILKKMKFNVVGTSIGAYFFAFSLPASQYFGHEQFLPRFAIPFAIYFTLRFMKDGDIRSYSILCCSVVYQFYCSIYMGYFLTLGVIAIILSCVLIRFSDEPALSILYGDSKALYVRLLVTVTSVLLLLPLMYPYYLRSKTSNKNSWELIADSLPKIKSYLLPVDSSLAWKWLLPILDTSALGGARLFFGIFPILALIAITLVCLRFMKTRSLKTELVVIVAIVIITIQTLNISGYSMYKLLYFLPGVSSIRVVSRVVLIDLFLLSILLASVITLVSDLLKKASMSIKLIATSILIVLFILDQLIIAADIPHYSKLESQSRYNKVVSRILSKDPSSKVFVYLPEDSHDDPVVDTLDAMLAAQVLNIPTVNGYSGYWPKDYRININRKDVCSGLIKWIGMSKHNNSAGSSEQLLDNLTVIGGESCTPQGRLPSYSYYDGQMPKEAFMADIRLPHPNISVAKGVRSLLIPLQIQNISTIKWPASAISVAFRWLTDGGKPMGEYKAHGSLYFDLAPGKISAYDLQVIPPSAAGKYLLELDLVQKNITSFHQKGSQIATANVIVE
jgi:hypothetical protein